MTLLNQLFESLREFGRIRIGRFALVAVLCAGTLFGNAPSRAQCTFEWKPGNSKPGISITGAAAAFLVHDDGNGPALYVGGGFTEVGSISANDIAKWDGNNWSALGSGMNGAVEALAVFNGALIAAGDFTTAGGGSANRIASWNGSSWSALGSGVNGEVRALIVHNGALIAAGRFTTAGGSSANRIAKWDGSSWSALGSGMSDTGSSVNALAVFNGALIAGGSFGVAGGVTAIGIASWNGSSWSPVGSGMAGSFGGTVNALTVFESTLIAAGLFDIAGGVNANNVARWDGSNWSALGGGVGIPQILDEVYALGVSNGALYAGGKLPNSNIARWNGTSWSVPGGGIGNDENNTIFSVRVSALTAFDGALIVGGVFGRAGNRFVYHIAQWDDSSWSTLGQGMNNSVLSLAVQGGTLVAGGNFTLAGGVADARKIARWDGSSWSGLGVGVTDATFPLVNSVAANGGSVFATGDFHHIGSANVNFIAQWNGSSWSAMGSGLNDFGYALTVYGGDLIAGGSFFSPGNLIARWDGGGWSALGSPPWISTGHAVQALTVHDGKLIVGLGDSSSPFLASVLQWDGSSWVTLGSMAGMSVAALTTYRGELIAAGDFTTANGVSANRVAKWDGLSWSPLGSGINGNVNALTAYNGALIAGGSFTTAGGVSASNIAQWNGSSWSAMGSGTDNVVNALTVHDGELIAGGGFLAAGGNQSAYWARWAPVNDNTSDTDNDGILDVCDDCATVFNCSEIAVEQPLGTDISDGRAKDFGSVLPGANTSLTFTIKNTGGSDLTGLSTTIDGADAALFTVTSSPTAPVAPSDSTTFTVRFAPVTSGPKIAALHIATNDPDENPFDITLRGMGTPPEIVVEQPVGTNIVDGGTKTFNNVAAGANTSLVFTIKNTGPSNLTGLGITIDGADAALFTVTANPTAPVAPGGSTTFTVRFAPTDFGNKTAALHIANNDLDENPFDINLAGLCVSPEIVVEQPAGTDIPDGGARDYGTVVVGANSSFIFTIRNISNNATLTGVGVTVTGTHASMFSMTATPSSIVPSGDSTTFTVRFAPTSGGAKTAALRISSNDFNENPFDINLTGTASVAEIEVEEPAGTLIIDGGVRSFGSVAVGGNASLTFTVRNTGTGDLLGLGISINGADPASFTVTTSPTAPVAPGGSTTFTVRFAPTTAGAKSAALHIASNDTDENPFDISLSGTGLGPEIVVEQPLGTNIADGGSKSFGGVIVGEEKSLVFTIKNTGNQDLTGLGITIDGADAALFTLTAAPTAPVGGPSGSTAFTVRFLPTSTGNKSAVLHIANNDFDESPFDINLFGTGTVPEIVVEQPFGADVPDGGSRSFGSIAVGGNTSLVFSIRNTGLANLTGLGITFDGADAAMFTVTSAPTSPVGPSGLTEFTVRFAPTASGTRSAALHIASNDADENPFDINLSGTGLGTEIAVEQPAGSDIADGGSRDFGGVVIGANTSLIFTIRNTGNSDLTGLGITVNGTDAAMFAITAAPIAPVGGPTGTTTFTVRFAPTSTGAKTAALHIANNDPDENPFDIDLSGIGLFDCLSLNCSDGNPCTDDSCTPTTGCGHANNTAPCDDGQFCTVGEVCAAGSCGGGAPRDCSAQSNACNVGACDNVANVCVRQPANESGACDDGNTCTQSDVCQSGTCAGSPVVDGLSCNDGDACTQSDTCRAGTCLGYGAAPDGTVCSDGNGCTIGETCRGGACLPPVSFAQAPGSPVPTGFHPLAFVIADLNGDAKLDLAVANQANDNVSVFLGDGSGGFAPAAGSPVAVGVNPVAVTVGNWNHDSAPDLAVTNQGSNNLTILLGNGAGGFTPAAGSPVAAGISAQSGTTGDWNGDNNDDIAVTSFGSNNVTILLGNGAGGFSVAAGSPVAVGAGPISIGVGDWNGNGKLDLAVVNSSSNNVTIFLGNGLGGFSPAPGSPVAVGTSPRSVAVGDVNRDAKLDLVVANGGSNSATVLLGNGLGGFSQAPGSPIPIGFLACQSVALGDLNGDGKLDFAAANENSHNVAIHLGNGLGGFGRASISPLATGINPHSVRIADLNRDGKLDLVACNDTSASLTLYLNTTSFTPDGTTCDDGNACSGSDACHTGACAGTPLADGTICDDKNACTLADTCQAGSCTSTTVAPNGTSCNDANACTSGDVCVGAVCGGTAGSAPSEVDAGVRLSKNGANAVITWHLAAGATSSAILRGLVAALPVGPGGGDENCLVTSLPNATLSWSDGDGLQPGVGFWYLIRGDNVCGRGPYGFQTVGAAPTVPRTSASCP